MGALLNCYQCTPDNDVFHDSKFSLVWKNEDFILRVTLMASFLVAFCRHIQFSRVYRTIPEALARPRLWNSCISIFVRGMPAPLEIRQRVWTSVMSWIRLKLGITRKRKLYWWTSIPSYHVGGLAFHLSTTEEYYPIKSSTETSVGAITAADNLIW